MGNNYLYCDVLAGRRMHVDARENVPADWSTRATGCLHDSGGRKPNAKINKHIDEDSD